MDQVVTSKNGFKLVVYDSGYNIRYCLADKFNPHIINDRDPKFNGSFQDCIEYIKRN